MAQYKDLELLRATRARQQPDKREQVPHGEIHERPEQAALPRLATVGALNLARWSEAKSRTSLRTLRAECWPPSRLGLRPCLHPQPAPVGLACRRRSSADRARCDDRRRPLRGAVNGPGARVRLPHFSSRCGGGRPRRRGYLLLGWPSRLPVVDVAAEAVQQFGALAIGQAAERLRVSDAAVGEDPAGL